MKILSVAAGSDTGRLVQIRSRPHGVGKTRAHDHTSGTLVTSFKHSTALYNRAMDHNRRLDGDQDGIACEKA